MEKNSMSLIAFVTWNIISKEAEIFEHKIITLHV